MISVIIYELGAIELQRTLVYFCVFSGQAGSGVQNTKDRDDQNDV